MTDPNRLIDRYLDGQLTPEENTQLENDLRDKPEHADDFAKAMLIDTLLKEKYEWESLISAVGAPDAGEQPGQHDAQRLEFWPNLAYVFAKGSRKIIRSQSAWLAAAAAVVVLVLWLVNPFAKTPPPDMGESDTPIADQATPAPVATLTATHKAKWEQPSGGEIPRGSALHAGDRLTLTHGFAEITTKDGALVILEAPAAVELIADNAIRLHAGKLIGICETDTSKGLLVQTPHMDITDMGTRFGVDATQAQRTDVYVFEGRVRVVLPQGGNSSDTQRVLSTGQSIAAQSSQGRLVAAGPVAERFVSMRVHGPFNNRESLNLSGVLSVTGDLKIAPASLFVGVDHRQWPDGDDAVVFQEFAGQLTEAIKVDIAEPGKTNQRPRGTRPIIPAGTSVRSYIVMKTSGSEGKTQHIQGTMTFDHDILGVIVDAETAGLFDGAMGSTPRLFTPGGGTHRWVDPHSFADFVSISEDKRTLAFQFEVKESADTVRVLVLAKDADRRPED